MAGICTATTRSGGVGCDHRIVDVLLDGEEIEVHVQEAELDAEPWDVEAKQKFIRSGLLRLRKLGLSLDNLLGLVTNGEEATNVKQYGILTKDVTKTNIGTAYVNVPPGANGERTLVEFTGCTEFRIMVHGLLNGTGPHQMRIVRDSDNAVIYESASITAQAGEREFDTGILPLPAEATGLMYVRFQAKSTTATDDPIYRRCVLMVR